MSGGSGRGSGGSSGGRRGFGRRQHVPGGHQSTFWLLLLTTRTENSKQEVDGKRRGSGYRYKGSPYKVTLWTQTGPSMCEDVYLEAFGMEVTLTDLEWVRPDGKSQRL